MADPLDLAAIFREEAQSLRRAREDALRIHPTDIRAAGNQVEGAVREYLRRMLEPRYHVTSGHLIDRESRVSPQIDIIIADNFGLPSLLTTRDGTEYIPITSVHAIGEVKSTYYRYHDYYKKMRDDLRYVSGMHRPLIENTAHGGLKDTTIVPHMMFPTNIRYLNNLYSFLLCIDGGDFSFDDLREILIAEEPQYLPSTTVLLDRGVVAYGRPDQRGGVTFTKYPHEVSQGDYDWCFFAGLPTEGGSLEGSHLAYLYGGLVEHVSNSHLEPPNAYQYTEKMSGSRRSSLLWARDGDR